MQFIVLGRGDYVCQIGSVVGHTTDASAEPVAYPAVSFMKLATPMANVTPGEAVAEGADLSYIDDETVTLVFKNGVETAILETFRQLVEGGVNTSIER